MFSFVMLLSRWLIPGIFGGAKTDINDGINILNDLIFYNALLHPWELRRNRTR
jgi:hypothetical protein